MISFYLKSTEDVSFEKSLRHYLHQNYDAYDLDGIQGVLRETQKLRDNANSTSSIRGIQQQIENYKGYFGKLQLLAKASVLSGANNSGASIEFSWADSFKEDKLAVSKNPSFEKNCVLFNIAVLLSKKALTEDRKSSAGIKESTKCLLKSASIFAHLVGETQNVSVEHKTMDMAQNALCVAALVMQAQAQACFFEKAQADKFSINLIAKLAISVSELYGKAERNLDKDEPLKSWIKKGDYPFHTHISAQKLLFLATACFWMSKDALYGKKYGEEITWLRKSREHLRAAEKVKTKSLHKNIEKSKDDLSSLVEKELERSFNDNNSIYHYRVPDESEFDLPGGKLLAVIKKFNPAEFENCDEENMLYKLVPVSVARLSRRIRTEVISDLEALSLENNEKNSKLVSLLEEIAPSAVQMSQSLPPELNKLLANIGRIRQTGGTHFLQESLENIKNKHCAVRAQHQTLETTLNSIEDSDKINRQKYGGNWSLQPPTRTLNAYLAEAKLIANYISDAEKSNEKMEERLEKLKPSIDFLQSQDQTKLYKMLPNSLNDLDNTEFAKEARIVREKVRNLMKEKNELFFMERQEIEKENFSKIVSKHQSGQTLSRNLEDTIASKVRAMRIDPIRTLLEQRESRINTLLEPLLAERNRLKTEMAQKTVFKEKEELLEKFEATIRGFDTLSAGLTAGDNFYGDLQTLYIDALSAKIADFSAARSAETRRKVAELEQRAAAAPREYYDENFTAMQHRMGQMNLRSYGGDPSFPHPNTPFLQPQSRSGALPHPGPSGRQPAFYPPPQYRGGPNEPFKRY